ncbi:hypothetical protein [Poseidonocella sp. HB161398]|uniref:hypothetical protein n=1 Tax=Poseidonocella sp. HB161398 TaxID=2320855 RepID=UPI00110987F6|nr:hypothetical protein [Poseidonocella sp. HB161398]
MKSAALLLALAASLTGCVEYSTSTSTTTRTTEDGVPLGSSTSDCRSVSATVIPSGADCA